MKFPFSSRIKKVRRGIEKQGLDAFLFSNLSNIFYLSGFTGSDGLLLCTPEKIHLLVDGRYGAQAESESKHAEVHVYESKPKVLGSLLTKMNIAKLGFEANDLRVSLYEEFQKESGAVGWFHAGDWLKRLRALKDEKEVALLHQAHGIANRAIEEVLKKVCSGMEERELALELEFEMKRTGAEALSFPVLVGSGPRGALPHASPSKKKLCKGEFVFVDFGCKLGNYCTDHTITFSLDEPLPKWRKIFELVKEAHDRAVAAAKPGLKISDLDAVSRTFLKENGYEKEFSHSLGHGIGIDVHEWPGISHREDASLEENMVFTIEPGVYLPGEGGVRIEDVVLLGSGGVEIFTNVDKGLRTL